VFIYSIIIHQQTETYISKLQYIAEIVIFKKRMNKTNNLKTLLNPFQHHCPNFFKPLTRTEARCNNCKKKFKFSTKITFNLITYLFLLV